MTRRCDTQARHDLPVDEALRRVRAARPFVAPNPGFLSQLHELEGTIRRCGSEGRDVAAAAAASAADDHLAAAADDRPAAAADDTASTNGADAEERRSLRNRVVGLGVRLYAQVGRSATAGGLELIDSQSQLQHSGRMDMAS